MKYPFSHPVVIDVTKPPYCADNTGKTDCTAALCRVFDDVLVRERDAIWETADKLMAKRVCDEDVYLGFECRIQRGSMRVIFPEFVPPARIIYLPAGTYLVSDTVSYTMKDLYNIMAWKSNYTMTRGIHVVGDGPDKTVIRLADHSAGFDGPKKKAVLAYTTDPFACETERSNVSQLNTCVGLTVDCGEGNPSALGLRFVANNSGRVENMRFVAKDAWCALELVYATEGVFRNITVDGFDYGVHAVGTSMCVLDGLDLSGVREAGMSTHNGQISIRRSTSGERPFLRFEKPSQGSYVFFGDADPLLGNDRMGNDIYQVFGGEVYKNGEKLCELPDFDDAKMDMPTDFPSYDLADCAYVDDFGAIGDGVTDSTDAIRAAMAAGKPTVVFGSGHYLVSGQIEIPATVERVDFMFCDFFAAKTLKRGEVKSLFEIVGDSDRPLLMENLYTFEQFYGHFRLICHACRRDLILRDLHTQVASMYYNTVPGSRVYLDNSVCTSGSYSLNTCLRRPDKTQEYAVQTPFEFHGQTVLAYNLNPERADLEVLCDATDLTVYGLKTEGPGESIKVRSGGVARFFVNSAGIGNPIAKNPLFSIDESSKLYGFGSRLFGVFGTPLDEFPFVFDRVTADGVERTERERVNPYYFELLGDKLI